MPPLCFTPKQKHSYFHVDQQNISGVSQQRGLGPLKKKNNNKKDFLGGVRILTFFSEF